MKQRGFLSPNMLIGLGIVAALALAVWGVNTYLNNVEQRGYDRGVAVTSAAVRERDNTVLQGALRRVNALQDQARKQEAESALAIDKIAKQLAQEKANGKKVADSVAADIASGRLMRRDDAFTRGSAAVGGGSASGAPGAAARGGDGAAPCKLSESAERSVLAIGADADEVAKQLAGAQAVIVEYQRTCGVK